MPSFWGEARKGRELRERHLAGRSGQRLVVFFYVFGVSFLDHGHQISSASSPLWAADMLEKKKEKFKTRPTSKRHPFYTDAAFAAWAKLPPNEPRWQPSNLTHVLEALPKLSVEDGAEDRSSSGEPRISAQAKDATFFVERPRLSP